MADTATSSLNELGDSGISTVPMYDRVILAFLARSTNMRLGDEELLSKLEDPHSKAIASVILHPDAEPSTPEIALIAERFFLDASNREAAEVLRKHIEQREAKEVTSSLSRSSGRVSSLQTA